MTLEKQIKARINELTDILIVMHPKHYTRHLIISSLKINEEIYTRLTKPFMNHNKIQ